MALAAAPAAGQLTNVVLNRPVVVDSTNGPTVPGWAAVNGNNTTSSRRWVSGSGPMPHWIEISLDGYYELSQF
ncbi:hypothetical protein RZS08_43230, partial [Arthrospira platensis SPKY1]|nr:hypothetical protein [Arthrospira platensis SPKY1]